MNQKPDETSSAVKGEILQKYEKFAPWYDLGEGVLEFLGVKNQIPPDLVVKSQTIDIAEIILS